MLKNGATLAIINNTQLLVRDQLQTFAPICKITTLGTMCIAVIRKERAPQPTGMESLLKSGEMVALPPLPCKLAVIGCHHPFKNPAISTA